MENKSNRTTKMEDDYLKMAMQAAARAFDVDSEDILGRRRTEPLVFARQTAYWLIHSGLGLTYSKIGRMFNRDHGNIIHGVRVYIERQRCGLCRHLQVVVVYLADTVISTFHSAFPVIVICVD